MAGETMVSGFGVFLYVRSALWKGDCREPPGPVLPAIIRLTVFTAVSALLLACGLYADDILCWTPQLDSSSWVWCEVNSGPPSVVRLVGIPNEAKMSLSTVARPVAPPVAGFTMGQPEYLSTTTR